MSVAADSRPFSELLSNVVDNRGRTCPTDSSGIALIATNCIKNDSLYPVYEKVRYVSEETYRTWFRGHPLPGDLIVVTKGTPGCVCMVPPKVDFCIAQDMVAIRADEQKVDSKYLFAALRSKDIQGEIENLHVGSLIPHFKKGDFDKLLIPLPEKKVQEYIGDQYFQLSAKIDLLHRQNKTLEALAETLWQRFFADERKNTWQECTVGELADHNKTSIHPNRNPDTLFYHYSVPAFDETMMPTRELGTLILSNKYEVSRRTILFSKLNPHRDKRIWIIPDSIPENSICSTEFQVMKPKVEKYLFFLYGFLNHPQNYYEIAAGVGGTSSSHQRIDPDVIFKTKAFLPDNETLISYNEMVEPIFLKMYHNRKAICTLAGMRDTLLPRLMSGEISVKSFLV